MDKRVLAHETLLRYRVEIVRVIQDLVRTPSQNTPPDGAERACQEYVADYLRRTGLVIDMYEPDKVPGLVEHPAFWPGRHYTGRPNVSSTLEGKGGGRSLLLTGHMDTVPLGDNVWSKPPWGADIHDGRMYGLGTIDMKGAMGAMMVLCKALVENKIPLRGALSFESVVDEEEAGVNATIAGRLRHGPMDGAVIPENTALQIYPAARGILDTIFTFRNRKAALHQAGTGGQDKAGAVEQIGLFITHLHELEESRSRRPIHPLYAGYSIPAPVEIAKVYAGGWGSQNPVAVPPEGRIELLVETLPGEERAAVQQEQDEWMAGLVARYPQVLADGPDTRHPIRYLPGTAMDPKHPLVKTMQDSIRQVLGREPIVTGAPYACDMFALHQIFGMPALLFGPAGGNAHAADEYLEMDSLFEFFETLMVFVMAWCGLSE